MVAWIERSQGPGARIVGVEALPASATAKHRVEVVLPGGSRRQLVLRRYHDRARLARDPWYVPAHEALALELLAESRVPAPRLYAADLEGGVCGVPALLESWMPGVPAWRPRDLERYLRAAAETLAAIHRVSVPDAGRLPGYAPYHQREKVVPPAFSSRPGLWERVAERIAAAWPAHRPTFIHRDYHPGNILWDGARVTGVVDWATAAWGPPGIDVARMRQNLASHLGRESADRFAAAYVAAGGDPSARHPFWDLLDAADSVADLASAAGPGGGDLGRFEEYVEHVLGEG